jgi:hypothetical protein
MFNAEQRMSISICGFKQQASYLLLPQMSTESYERRNDARQLSKISNYQQGRAEQCECRLKSMANSMANKFAKLSK